MINIELEYKNDLIKKVKIHGHSGYAEAGSDIVCAGVSALTQTIGSYLEETLPKSSFNVVEREDENNPTVELINSQVVSSGEQPEITFKNADWKRVDYLLNVLVYGLEQLCEQYPEYIQIKNKEEQ